MFTELWDFRSTQFRCRSVIWTIRRLADFTRVTQSKQTKSCPLQQLNLAALCKRGWTKWPLKVPFQPKLFNDSAFLLHLSKWKYFRLNVVWQNRGKKQLSKHVDINSLLSQLLWNQEPQKHRMVEVGRDLFMPACPALLLKQDYLQPASWTAALLPKKTI